MADRRTLLSDWLARHGVEQDWRIAPPLAAAGVDVAWCERVAAVLGSGTLEPGLEWVASTLSPPAPCCGGEGVDPADLRPRRRGPVLLADRPGSLQRIDVTDGIESTLVMLGHKLRDGVTVVRDYGADVPRIEAYAGELNQVWTNLIDNAVDAMDGRGHAAHHHPGRRRPTSSSRSATPARACRREVAGPRVRSRSTRPRTSGKGTGLGLDIAQRIVVRAPRRDDRHRRHSRRDRPAGHDPGGRQDRRLTGRRPGPFRGGTGGQV